MVIRHFDGKIPSDFDLNNPSDVKALTHILNVTSRGGKGLWFPLPNEQEAERQAIGFRPTLNIATN